MFYNKYDRFLRGTRKYPQFLLFCFSNEMDVEAVFMRRWNIFLPPGGIRAWHSPASSYGRQ